MRVLGYPGGWQATQWRRFKEAVHHRLTPVVYAPSKKAASELLLLTQQGRFGPFGWLRHIPGLPPKLDPIHPVDPWPEPSATIPDALKGRPGVEHDPEAQHEAFLKAPLHTFSKIHAESNAFLFYHGWNFLVPMLPRLLRAYERLIKTRGRVAGAPGAMTVSDPAVVSARIREEARRLGISAVGFAPFDPHYQYGDLPHDGTPNVIVCVLEQDWAATQTIPSGRAERSAMRAYADLMEMVAQLAEFMHDMDYRVSPQDFAGASMQINYGVEAGLGQMGLNGQLLTPHAGSRCRLALITTDAPVELKGPVDYGIEALSDSCQLCVRRCPVGAIPAKRGEHRGVVKAKIKTERCYPTMIQTHGCAVCMKVCPVQRYGLEAVHNHFSRTGEVLGKDTDELEGYAWPLDGKYYGSGQKPSVGKELIEPEGFIFDKTRTAPQPDTASTR